MRFETNDRAAVLGRTKPVVPNALKVTIAVSAAVVA